MTTIEVAKGLATYIPGLMSLRQGLRKEQVTPAHVASKARYCYSIWLRHMVVAAQNGLEVPPKALLELGPGDTLGVGLAALLSGTGSYRALDIVSSLDRETSDRVLGELVTLFHDRCDVPVEGEFPRLGPVLDSHDFPDHILAPQWHEAALRPARLETIRQALSGRDQPDGERQDGDHGERSVQIDYVAPWKEPEEVPLESVDMVVAQAVMEYVPNVKEMYGFMRGWLRHSGFISLTIDYSAHGTASAWDGHWAHSLSTWRLIRGNRAFFLNRRPHSEHRSALREAGFEIVREATSRAEPQTPRELLAHPFALMSEDDRTTHGAHIIARKR